MRKHQRRWHDRVRLSGSAAWLAGLLAIGLLVVSCGPITPTADVQSSPLVADSPLTSATPVPALSPSATPAPTATPQPTPIQLVVLHTNDVWGETEPCG